MGRSERCVSREREGLDGGPAEAGRSEGYGRRRERIFTRIEKGCLIYAVIDFARRRSRAARSEAASGQGRSTAGLGPVRALCLSMLVLLQGLFAQPALAAGEVPGLDDLNRVEEGAASLDPVRERIRNWNDEAEALHEMDRIELLGIIRLIKHQTRRQRNLLNSGFALENGFRSAERRRGENALSERIRQGNIDLLLGAGAATMDWLDGTSLRSDWLASSRRTAMYARSATYRELHELSCAERALNQAGDMRAEARAMDGNIEALKIRLARYKMEQLYELNKILAGIRGYAEAGLGKAVDIIYVPEVEDPDEEVRFPVGSRSSDSRWMGEMLALPTLIHSFVCLVDGKPTIVKLSDLHEYFKDRFASALAALDERAEKVRNELPDARLAVLKAELEKTNEGISRLRAEVGDISWWKRMFEPRFRRMVDEIDGLKAKRKSIRNEIARLSKRRRVVAECVEDELAGIDALKDRIVRAGERLSRLDQADARRALEEIERLA